MPTEQRHRRPESYVVNWRERYKCFHVETVEEILLRNRRNFEQSVEVDFVPITFAASITEANEAAEKYRQIRGIPLLQDQILEPVIDWKSCHPNVNAGIQWITFGIQL